MAIRVRMDGTMWCAAMTEAQDGDTYIDDGLHYTMSAERGVIVALPEPEHSKHPQWWWANASPPEADHWVVLADGCSHANASPSADKREG